MSLTILHISDTHGFHNQFPKETFDGIDMIIHSGDCSNWRDVNRNQVEVMDFLNWYADVPVANKIFVAGNHDTSIERKRITKEDFTAAGIHYLENESIEIEGLKIWGSPITPTFGDWSFMKARDKTHEVWKEIPLDTDVVVVHGPPKGVRDLSYDRQNNLEFCGDLALTKRMAIVHPQLMLFGHIHNCKDIINQGVSTYSMTRTKFSNGSCVEDGRFDYGLTSFGNKFKI